MKSRVNVKVRPNNSSNPTIKELRADFAGVMTGLSWPGVAATADGDDDGGAAGIPDFPESLFQDESGPNEICTSKDERHTPLPASD